MLPYPLDYLHHLCDDYWFLWGAMLAHRQVDQMRTPLRDEDTIIRLGT